MGVIKAKNSAGEWVSVAGTQSTEITNFLGNLDSAIVKIKTNAYAYDLSQYIKSDDNFLLFFKCTTNSSISASGGGLFILEKVGDSVRKAQWNDNVSDMGWFNNANELGLSTLFKDGWLFDGTWDNDTCTLTFPTYGASSCAILLYAKVKEA